VWFIEGDEGKRSSVGMRVGLLEVVEWEEERESAIEPLGFDRSIRYCAMSKGKGGLVVRLDCEGHYCKNSPLLKVLFPST